jgi:hypothetical protein
MASGQSTHLRARRAPTRQQLPNRTTLKDTAVHRQRQTGPFLSCISYCSTFRFRVRRQAIPIHVWRVLIVQMTGVELIVVDVGESAELESLLLHDWSQKCGMPTDRLDVSGPPGRPCSWACPHVCSTRLVVVKIAAFCSRCSALIGAIHSPTRSAPEVSVWR